MTVEPRRRYRHIAIIIPGQEPGKYGTGLISLSNGWRARRGGIAGLSNVLTTYFLGFFANSSASAWAMAAAAAPPAAASILWRSSADISPDAAGAIGGM